jgi:RluA family pseudouridine synthase
LIKDLTKYKFKDLNILFEDDDLIVINKPAGMLTIPDRYNKDLPNLRTILTEHFESIFVVHRLDKETSGVIVFAKNADAHRELNQQFMDIQLKKIYHAVVEGIVVDDEFSIDIPIMPDPRKVGKSMPSSRGKDSLTVLKVMERYKNATLVELNLVTGRHHQIRVHCSAIGHPLLVDEMYGSHTEFKLSQIKRKFNIKKNDEEKPIISRVTMHAQLIEFEHPTSHEKVEVSAEYPKDFEALLQVLRKYA